MFIVKYNITNMSSKLNKLKKNLIQAEMQFKIFGFYYHSKYIHYYFVV